MRSFTLVTGNAGKLAEARRLLGFDVPAEAVDLPEIQSLDMGEVLRAKGEEAFRRLGRPVVVEETGLELAALGGFPGPLVKWMLEAVGAEGIARTALALGDPRATARCRLLYLDGGHPDSSHPDGVIEGEGVALGELVLPSRGDAGFGWDPVFRPEDCALTYAELGMDEKDRIGHRGRAWRDLLARL